jgi:TRAP-type C4-dicarboxylate transport system permease small subunit
MSPMAKEPGIRAAECSAKVKEEPAKRAGDTEQSSLRHSRLAPLLQRAANAIGGGLFLTLFAVFIIQIGARFGFNQPLPWTDEAAVILYIWVILWAAAFVVPAREHVVFDLVWNSAGTRTRQVMAIAGNLMVGGLALAGLPATWDYVHFMQREGTPVLGIPLMWVFLPLALLMVALVVRSAWAIWQAVQGRGLQNSDLRV